MNIIFLVMIPIWATLTLILGIIILVFGNHILDWIDKQVDPWKKELRKIVPIEYKIYWAFRVVGAILIGISIFMFYSWFTQFLAR